MRLVRRRWTERQIAVHWHCGADAGVAASYYDLANGRKKPHTKDMEMIAVMARAVIRDLVEDL